MPRPNVSEQRKLAILQAAAQVFTAQGLSIARMEDVAVAAGISKGTVYLYYASKDQLIEALLHQLFKPLDAALDQLIQSTAPFPARLLEYGLTTCATFADVAPLHPLILELFALARRQPFAGQVFGQYFVRYRDSLTALLQQAADVGELSLAAYDQDARAAALAYMALIEGLLLLALLNPELLDLRAAGEQLIRAWLKQV